MNTFAQLHPMVLFFYYITVLMVTMFLCHPVQVVITLCSSILFYSLLCDRKRVRNDIVYYFFVFLFLSILNPLFSHNGATILFFMNDNPITLEAIIYGMVVAGMIISVIFWCKCYQLIMTTDKFLYLFGTFIPKLSLVISMAIRYLPLMKRQAKEIHKVQKTMGLYSGDSVVDRLRNGIRVFESLLSWSIENSLDTADSMQARGYGSKPRTNYSSYQLRKQDVIVSLVIAITTGVVIFGIGKGYFTVWYYPTVSKILFHYKVWVAYVAIGILMLLPTVLTVKENIRWNYLKSKL